MLLPWNSKSLKIRHSKIKGFSNIYIYAVGFCFGKQNYTSDNCPIIETLEMLVYHSAPGSSTSIFGGKQECCNTDSLVELVKGMVIN